MKEKLLKTKELLKNLNTNHKKRKKTRKNIKIGWIKTKYVKKILDRFKKERRN